MKLHAMHGSRYGARVAIQIAAKGLDVPLAVVPVPIPDSFRKINPLGLVPVLEIDGTYLPESQVICEYLEDLGQGPSLRPDAPLACARMRLLIRFFELYYDPPMLEIYKMIEASPDIEKAKVEAALPRVKRGLELLARHLTGDKYAVDEKLTLADCALMPPFLQATLLFPRLGWGDLIGDYPTVAAYYAKTRTDPHVAEVLAGMIPPLTAWFGAVVCR